MPIPMVDMFGLLHDAQGCAQQLDHLVTTIAQHGADARARLLLERLKARIGELSEQAQDEIAARYIASFDLAKREAV